MPCHPLNRKQFLRLASAGAFSSLGPGRLLAQPAVKETSPASFYPPDFRLKPLSVDRMQPLRKPAQRSAGLQAPSWIDHHYGTRIHKVTAASDFPGAEFVRHNYSRRQAFNADNTRFIALSSNGFWLLYSGTTFERLKRGGQSGALLNLAGDAEAIWHPTDPRLLWYTGINGGLVWWEKDVESDSDIVMADFRKRLPWPAATSVWTKGEGTSSADGRYFAFMATSYNETTKVVNIHGLFSYDRVNDRIVGRLDAASFGNAMPDHISISPGGRWVVPSWAFQPKLGVRAYSLDFSTYRQLDAESEHSDLVFGPRGEEFYVHTNYRDGVVTAKDMATGAAFNLMSLYPRRGSNLGAAHFSGKAYDRPGWVLMSTYDDAADRGKTKPDPVPQPGHNKIMLLELKPNGRQYNVAHTRVGNAFGGYWGEPQATISRDGTRILFASNFDDGGPPNSYLIVLPPSVYR
jgi:hypothetical protein